MYQYLCPAVGTPLRSIFKLKRLQEHTYKRSECQVYHRFRNCAYQLSYYPVVNMVFIQATLFDLRSCCGCLHESPNTLHAVKAGMRLVQAHVKHYGPLALQDANRKVRECQNRSSAVLGARTITRAYAGDQKLANKVYQMLHSFAEDHRPAALLLLFQPRGPIRRCKCHSRENKKSKFMI